jgi:putative ABC transport system permease protein
MWLINVQLALRNLLKNYRRTLLSIAIIALGTAMSFAVRGYVVSSLEGIQVGIVQQFGNFQIAEAALFDNETEGFDALIPPEDFSIINGVLSNYSEITAINRQLNFSGLAAFGQRSKVLLGISVIPGIDAVNPNDLLTEGDGLQPDDSGKVLIGKSLAEERNLAIGDSFRINASTVDGAYNVGGLEVAGIFSLNSQQFEGQLIYVPLEYAQLLLNTDGVGRVIVLLDSVEASQRIADAVEADLRAAGLNYDVRIWTELSEFFQQITGFFNALFVFLTLAVSILVFFIVLQVLTMSFLERTREVGTIRALGTKSSQVFSMFIAEGILLGLFGGLTGVGLGWIFSIGFNALGVGWTPPGALEPVPLNIGASLSVATIPFLVSFFATSLSALFPSLRSARSNIVEALGSN